MDKAAKNRKERILFNVGEEIRKPQTYHIPLILVLYATLLLIGLSNLYSATQGNFYFYNQLRNLLLVIPAFVVFAWVIPTRKLNEYAYVGYALVCLALIIVMVLGRVASGAQRWLSIGFISFQPSEVAKIMCAIVVARFFSVNRQPNAYRLRDMLPLIVVVGFIFALIFEQPDFGTAGVCLMIALAQIAFIRVDFRSVIAVLVATPAVALFGWHVLLMDYQKLRVLNLLNPDHDPLNSGYNSLQSLIAIGSGGLLGKGFMQGTQTHLKFLPERHTDFIFSVFAEEHGLVGAAVVFLIFGLLTHTAIDISRHSKDIFSSLLAVGIAAFIFLEFSINTAMVLGIFPVVGIPLPFFSYGSSMMLTMSASLGMLVNIHRTSLAR
jgi:rod shape determining protein RodA